MSYLDLYPPRGSLFRGRAFVCDAYGAGGIDSLHSRMIAEAKDMMVLDALRQQMERHTRSERDKDMRGTVLSCDLVCMTVADYEEEIRRAYLCGKHDKDHP
jgi:hypothetical protein